MYAWQPREIILTFVRTRDSAAKLRRDSKAGCAMTSLGMFRPASTATNAGYPPAVSRVSFR